MISREMLQTFMQSAQRNTTLSILMEVASDGDLYVSATCFSQEGIPIPSRAMQLVVTSMAERSPVSLRETAGIEGRATLRATKTRFVPRLANSFHLLCKIYILVAARALRCSTTPLAHRATSRGGTQFTHERRAVPSAGSTRRQGCDPACPGCSVPVEREGTTKSCRTTGRDRCGCGCGY